MEHPRVALLCTANGWGGLELNTRRLAQQLREKGWDIILLTGEDTPLHRGAIEYGLPVATVPEVQGWGSKRRAARAVVAALRESGAAVLLTPYNRDIALAARCKKRMGKGLRVIYQQHMKVGVPKRDFVHTRRYKAIDSWISPLPYLKAETLQLTRVPEEKIRIIPFGLPPEKLETGGQGREAARATAGLPQDALVIGVLGRMDRKKGQDFAIRALHTWNTKFSSEPAHLLIQGDPTPGEGDEYLETCRSLVIALGLQEQVHFRGHAGDVSGFFAAIDVFAMPAQGETYGMVTLEAMASFVPVIGTDTDGTRALLQEGRLGYLYELENTEQFCTQLRALLSNPNLQDIMQEAHDTVRRDFTEEAALRQTEDLLKSMVNGEE